MHNSYVVIEIDSYAIFNTLQNFPFENILYFYSNMSNLILSKYVRQNYFNHKTS